MQPKYEISGRPHGGGGHRGGGHHHHHGGGRRGGGAPAAWLGPAYDWPPSIVEQPIVYVLPQELPKETTDPVDDLPPPSEIGDSAVAGLHAKYAPSKNYQTALQAVRGILRGGAAQQAAVVRILELARAGDPTARRFVRYLPLAAKQAQVEVKTAAASTTAAAGCYGPVSPAELAKWPAGTVLRGSAVSGAGGDLLAAGRQAMQRRQLGGR